MMIAKKGNLFLKIPKELPEELFQTIAGSKNCRIERIISPYHITPENKWYDQKQNEFVLLLKGSAEMLFEDNEIIKLKEGDYIIIPAHKKHKVLKTSSKKETIWLAVFY